jgi:hypothetical protein
MHGGWQLKLIYLGKGNGTKSFICDNAKEHVIREQVDAINVKHFFKILAHACMFVLYSQMLIFYGKVAKLCGPP